MPKGARAKMDQVVANIHTSYVGTSWSSLGQDATKEGGLVKKGADFKMAQDVSSEAAGAGRSSRSED